MLPLLLFLLAADVQVDYTRESLTGTHIHYQQYLNGVRVVGGERVETITRDGKRETHDHLAHAPLRVAAAVGGAPLAGELVYLNIDGEARLASRVVVEEQPYRPYANYYDAATGALIRSDALFWTAQGRVFDPNPVAKLNRPDLQDQNDAASAVPDSAYSIVDLIDLPASGPLAGPNVQIVDVQLPTTTRADASQSLMFDRSQAQFEEVNAYYHIDRTQRYLQSLGYTGNRRIVAYAIPVDPHAATGTDNSFFVTNTPGTGALFFGDGGTDDAEDSDIMLHEYGHAIQESIAPGAFGGSSSSQSRALGEGFGDYWSFSSTYEQTIPSGRDPFCIGDWDARCWMDDASQNCGYPAGADCLRRVDSAKTMANFIVSETPGTEHKNGEIWSSALREIFMKLGKRTTDTLVLEGTFGVPVGPSFTLMGQKLLAADRALNGGANSSVICSAMTSRGILTSVDCASGPRGELTFFQSLEHGLSGTNIASTLAINDSRAIERISVNVAVTGEAQITLTGPDGTRAKLQALDSFRGRSAAGMWTLAVIANEPVTLPSWSLAIQFAGDVPLTARPTAAANQQKFIAAVAHAPGANGTTFITDVRLFNRGTSSAQVTAIFTPTGGDGRMNFAAVKIVIQPSQFVAIDDIVQTLMQSSGTGQLQIVGASDQILLNSRTYTPSSTGTFGQFVPSAMPSESVGAGDVPLSVPGLENTIGFRSNIGFAEVAGVAGEVRVRFYDGAGNAVAEEVYGIAPFGHVQTRVNPAGEALRAEVTVAGDARVLAYGSMVDNTSGDAVFIPAARVRNGMFPAIHSAGANGTLWRTDVWLSNPSSAAEDVVINQRTMSVPARGAVILRDILGADGRTTLQVNTRAVLVTSRTYTIGEHGSFGQFVPPGVASNELATLIGIENSSAFRTNIGLLSQGSAFVRLLFFDAANRQIWREHVALDRFAQFQLISTLLGGRCQVQVLIGGPVVPYASVVDNVSGDPIFISAQY
ncbi:MAG TPA: M36 family metallopeptidase [Thermoanaerobaculia bacterium]|nr:M36 family metallopeptidase [Thermoanaerobaculia bacterium]